MKGVHVVTGPISNYNGQQQKPEEILLWNNAVNPQYAFIDVDGVFAAIDENILGVICLK